LSTPRKEADQPEFLAGIVDGYTCGAPIAAVIRNTNIRSADYDNLKDTPRPGHADYTAQIKYGGYQDASGGGHFSGRLTAPLCIAGGLCKQWLEEMGIRIGAHIDFLGGITDTAFDPIEPEIKFVRSKFPVLSMQAGQAMKKRIEDVRAEQDSLGGEIECAITGVPAGLGEPMFGGVESRLSQILYGIPAVKCVEFGAGKAVSYSKGSQINDPFTVEDGQIKTTTNHCGGILGGITNGMPILFRVSIKPTPSIGKLQQSVNLAAMEEVSLETKGRHDPCIVPRAVPVVEAAAAIAIYDLILGNTQTNRRK
jgi:chorismate synthase